MALVIGADWTLRVDGAQNSVTGAYFTAAATATYVVYNSAGTSVASGSMTFVTGSSGDFYATIDAAVTATFTANAAYYALCTLVEDNADGLFRVDATAQAPGQVVLDAQGYMQATGVTVTGDDLTALEVMAAAVSEALENRCYPVLLVPRTLNLFPFDAPVSNVLLLPRPIRTISALYVRFGANADSSTLEAGDLLTAGTDYLSQPDDVRTGTNKSGRVLRRGRSLWGYEVTRAYPNRLATTLEANRGAVFVSGSFGPATVSPVVRAAAVRAVTLLYNSRTLGGLAQSNSWNGGSFSFSSSVTANAAINAPDVTEMLRAAGVLPSLHVG